jgi:hypothetical protein
MNIKPFSKNYFIRIFLILLIISSAVSIKNTLLSKNNPSSSSKSELTDLEKNIPYFLA